MFNGFINIKKNHRYIAYNDESSFDCDMAGALYSRHFDQYYKFLAIPLLLVPSEPGGLVANDCGDVENGCEQNCIGQRKTTHDAKHDRHGEALN